MIYMWIFQTYFPALLEVYEFRLLQASLQLETITEWSHSGCDSRSLQVIGRVIVLYLLMEAHFKATERDVLSLFVIVVVGNRCIVTKP